MESTQLRYMQDLENSLSLLKFKIGKMAQLDSHKEDTINRVILSTIPVVDKKLREQDARQQIDFRKTKYGDRTAVLKRKNQESRFINEKEVAKSRELMIIMKQHNSMHLKKSKQQNEEKIRQIKELNLNDKK